MGGAISQDPITEQEKESILNHNVSVKEIADYIKAGKAKKICLMTGAGISVSAGIPDFRTPGTGLYANLAKYNLPKPESMFDIEYFQRDPTPFYDLARELLPSNFNPTPMHFFIKLLEDKNLLQRCYTQNIDTLERVAGVSTEKLVEAHGSFGSAFCTSCKTEYSQDYFRDRVINMTDGVLNSRGEKIPWCKCSAQVKVTSSTAIDAYNEQKEGKICNGNVKPSIVFFGESLPSRYFELREDDMRNADFLIVAGTSLTVSPFCDTMHYTNLKAPRLLINRDIVGLPTFVTQEDQGFQFNKANNYRDAALLGTCDEGILILSELLGWREELEALILESHSEWKPPTLVNSEELNKKVNFNYRNGIGNLICHDDKNKNEEDESNGYGSDNEGEEGGEEGAEDEDEEGIKGDGEKGEKGEEGAKKDGKKEEQEERRIDRTGKDVEKKKENGGQGVGREDKSDRLHGTSNKNQEKVDDRTEGDKNDTVQNVTALMKDHLTL